MDLKNVVPIVKYLNTSSLLEVGIIIETVSIGILYVLPKYHE